MTSCHIQRLVFAALTIVVLVAPIEAQDLVLPEHLQLLFRAQKGDAEAQHKLGLNYAAGEKILPDYDQALKWVKASAEQGNPAAMLTLADWYRTMRRWTPNSSRVVANKSDRECYVWAILAVREFEKKFERNQEAQLERSSAMSARLTRGDCERRLNPEEVREIQEVARRWSAERSPW